jgi:3-methylfumaryl-CoA hydratase
VSALSASNDAAPIAQWVGRTRQDEDEVTLGAVARLAATLDRDPAAFRRGGEVPESWYAILFAPVARQSVMGPDGHPTTGDFMPPMHSTRRMFAGRRVTFHQPLRIGERVSRVSTVTRAEAKTGRTGAFTLVTLMQEISGPAGLAVTEEQDVVYRAAVAVGTAARQTEAPRFDEKPEWTQPILLDPVLVFRYSAVTFNAHRIHYDLPYARDVEGYPALVMNGGLTALLLVEIARPRLGRPIAAYAARAMSPLFVGTTVAFNGRIAGDTAMLWATAPDGGLAYRLDVTLGESRSEPKSQSTSRARP